MLLHNVRAVHAGGGPPPIPDEGIEAYLQNCQERMGAAYFQTPRDTIEDFIGLLNVLRQNPGDDWRALIGRIATPPAAAADPSELAAERLPDDDDLANFKM